MIKPGELQQHAREESALLAQLTAAREEYRSWAQGHAELGGWAVAMSNRLGVQVDGFSSGAGGPGSGPGPGAGAGSPGGGTMKTEKIVTVTWSRKRVAEKVNVKAKKGDYRTTQELAHKAAHNSTGKSGALGRFIQATRITQKETGTEEKQFPVSDYYEVVP